MKTRGQKANEDKKKDISGGKEKHPIPVICPDDVELPKFEYITSHRPNPQHLPRERAKKVRCDCYPRCLHKTCPCHLMSKTLEQTVECSSNCGCKDDCFNKEFAGGMNVKVYLKYIDKTFGFGVFAGEPIQKGTYLGAYVGEIAEVKKNGEIMKSDYAYQLKSKVSGSTVEIDAARYGNITRFYNHNCDGNLKTVMAHFGREKWIHPVFQAKRYIKKGEQLTTNYGKNYFKNKGMRCKCGQCLKRKSDPIPAPLPVKIQRRYNSI